MTVRRRLMLGWCFKGRLLENSWTIVFRAWGFGGPRIAPFDDAALFFLDLFQRRLLCGR